MKNKRNYYLWLLWAAFVVAGFSSCGKSSPFEYIPFHSEGDDWGMMSVNGDVLFEDKFAGSPTFSYYGIFLVMDELGQWNYYTAEEHPRQLGNTYVSATMFSKGGVAVVARKGKCVEVIDRDGNVKFSLDKFDGKRVKYVSAFNDDGMAVVTLENESQGIVNESGDVVLSPHYCNMKLSTYGTEDNKYVVAIDAKYKDDYFYDDSNAKWLIMDCKGNVCAELSRQKYEYVEPTMKNLFVVSLVDGNGCGIIDSAGRYVVEPSRKYKSIGSVIGKKFLFTNDDGDCGACDFDGKVLIKAKYNGLAFLSENRLIAEKDGFISVIDIDGKELSSKKFDGLMFFMYGCDNLLLSKGNKIYCVDINGSATKLSDIVVEVNYADFTVASQVSDGEDDGD